MKTLAQLESENAAAVAKLQRELAIAALMPVAPDSVMDNGSRPAWVTYRARSLAQALELFAAFNIAPFYECRDSCLSLAPIDTIKNRERGRRYSGRDRNRQARRPFLLCRGRRDRKSVV